MNNGKKYDLLDNLLQLGMPADPEDPDPQTSGSLDPEPDPMGSDPRIQAPPILQRKLKKKR